jgi:hypothetical protein
VDEPLNESGANGFCSNGFCSNRFCPKILNVLFSHFNNVYITNQSETLTKDKTRFATVAVVALVEALGQLFNSYIQIPEIKKLLLEVY